ncbi:hypothetical protein VP01_959g2 [Puccinia sorghi]|uniref:Uncharacterized protein n=1 Tax=Puccinia sorghi TaxID=27349 RepID=A0A0L6U675_9BASI|nr:hypothetical protein VP01_959g2 [Puccinia sorghi]
MNRYLLIELIFAQPHSTHQPTTNNHNKLNEKALIDLIRRSIQLNFGDLAAGEAGADLSGTLKYYSPTTCNLILRCKRDQVTKVRASLLFITDINPQTPVIFNVIHVSGLSLSPKKERKKPFNYIISTPRTNTKLRLCTHRNHTENSVLSYRLGSTTDATRLDPCLIRSQRSTIH